MKFGRDATTLRILPAVALLLLAGCAVGPDYQPLELDTGDTWQVELTRGLAEGEANVQTWWVTLDDPQLTSLIDRASEDSLDIRLALSRIDAAAGKRGITRGEWFPSIDGGSSYERGRLSGNDPFGVGGGGSEDLYSAGIAGSWELDFFGRIRRSVEASTGDLQQTIEDYHDTLVVLYAQIGLTYVEARTFQERIRFNEQNIAAQRGTLELVSERNRAGLVGDLDVRQAEQNLGLTESLLPSLRQGYVQSVNRLGVLLGQLPSALHGELGAFKEIPQPPETVLVGLPRELLRQRPDVRSAERAVAAQTPRIGIATADLYPRFAVLGTFAMGSSDFSDWSSWGSRAFSIGPHMIWNIFDGGRIRSKIRVEEAITQETVAAYEQTVLEAVEDAESSMVAFVEEQNRRDALQRSATAAAQAVELVKTLYRTGLTDFQNVLDTERTLFTVQDQLAQSRGTTTRNLISVYRSLGGGWTP